MTSTKLSFIKKGFTATSGNDSAIAYSSSNSGAIVFDKNHNIICVDGVIYGGGNITDATYDQNVLKIWKFGDAAEHPSIELDFTDIASAKSMMKVFEQIEGIIGAPVISSGNDKGKPDYTGANYISAQTNLIQADLTLDAAIWGVQGKVESVQSYAEGVQGSLQNVESTLQGYINGVQGNLQDTETALKGDISNLNSYAQGVQGSLQNVESTLQGYINGVQGNLQTTESRLQGYIHATQGYVEDIASDLETTQGALESHMSDDDGTYKHWAEHIGVQGVQYGATSYNNVKDALVGLQGAIEDVEAGGKSYTILEQETAETGYLKTYYLQETDSTGSRQVGAKINIPKDFVVQSASVQTCQTADVPVQGLQPGDKYIDLVINTRDGSVTSEHLYIPVKDMVDPYTVSDTATIDLELDNSNNITATLKDGSVQGVHIANGAVDTQHIADNAVQTAKINDGAVTAGKIADGAVSSAKIAANAVTSVQMADGAVTSAKIAENAVTSTQMANGSVTSAKIAENAVTSTQLATDAVTTDKIADANVTSAKIANGAVTSVQMADGAVTSAKIGAGAVQSAQLGNNAVNSQHIAANAVQTAALQDGSVTKAKLAADALTTVQNYDASIQVNSTGQPYTLAKVNDTNITATVELYWEEWS